MRYPLDVVVKGVGDYYSGISLNNIKESIYRRWGLCPSDCSIYGWVKKLTKMALSKVIIYIPKIGDKWLAYDFALGQKDGKKYYLINIIDCDTRFLLASNLTDGCNRKDIINTFEAAKRRAGGLSPKVLLSNGWQACNISLKQVFWPDNKHLTTMHFKNEGASRNIMEDWNSVLKDRLRPTFGMNKSQTHQLLLKGFTIHYNFFIPNKNLEGKTPAGFAQIEYPYSSWQEIITKQAC